MENQTQNQINKYLAHDEYVVWNGKPGKGHLLTKYDTYMIPFSIMWCGFAIFWETGVLTNGAPFLFKVWGIPFVCIGLYMVFGRFIMKSYVRKETVYVITNKRVFSFRKNQVNTIDYHANPPRTITRNPDGSGSIYFGSAAATQNKLMNFYTPVQSSGQNAFELDNIPDIDRVLQILSN